MLQLLDELMSICQSRRVNDLFVAGPASAVTDVLGDCPVEEKCILFDDAQQPPVAVGGDVAQIDTVQLYDPLRGVIETSDEIAQCRLARAAWADECDHF